MVSAAAWRVRGGCVAAGALRRRRRVQDAMHYGCTIMLTLYSNPACFMKMLDINSSLFALQLQPQLTATRLRPRLCLFSLAVLGIDVPRPKGLSVIRTITAYLIIFHFSHYSNK